MKNSMRKAFRRMMVVAAVAVMSVLPASSALAASSVTMVQPAPMAPANMPNSCIMSENVQPNGELTMISDSTAAQLALDRVGASNPSVRDLRSSFTYVNGHPSYEVCFSTKEGSYKCIVNAVSGKVTNIFFS